MSEPDYVTKLRALGLNVPMEVLKPIRGFLLYPEATIPYMELRMDRRKPDVKWVETITVGSKARTEMEGAGASLDEIVQAAIEEGAQAVEKPTRREVLEGLALWFDRWIGKKGKVKLRNTINAKVHYQRRGRAQIALHPETAQKLNKLIEMQDTLRTFDDCVNYLISHLEEAKGIKL